MRSNRRKRMSKDRKYILFAAVTMFLSVISMLTIIPLFGGIGSLVITTIFGAIALWLGADSIYGETKKSLENGQKL